MGRRGFTLVEIMTVVIVLATIAAIMAPNLASSVKTNSKRSYLAAIDRMPALAKQLALTNGSTATLIIDEDGAMSIQQQLDTNDDPQTSDRVAANALLSPDRFVVGTNETSETEWQIRFFPDGTSDRGGIEFDDNGNRWYLSVDGQGNGRVQAGELPDLSEDRWEAGDNVQRG